MAYSAVFNNAFEALNLLLINLLYLCSRNSATWQWHSAPLSSKKTGKEGDCKDLPRWENVYVLG
jgi:hypothetical protein